MARLLKNIHTKTIIYTLKDPTTNQIRYVGKTVKPLNKRLSNHIYSINKESNYRTNWIKSIINKGTKPIIEELETCSWLESSEREIYWISQMRAWGFKLVNLSDGGEGNLGSSPSKENILKLRAIKSKKIYQYNLKGEYIKGFSSILEAANSVGLKSGTKIGMCALGKRKKAGEYMWSYIKMSFLPPYKRCTIISQQQRQIISKSRSIRLQQYDEKGNLMGEWDSIKLASVSLGVHYTSLVGFLNGNKKINSLNKYTWIKKELT